ncbi:MAG TPA: winged helix-turn-helix domain-containing protein [Nitrososphaera sp.]|jgi:predicted transcriptional regulator|nr:winged helix-turn-helix domain-containing protein [Nitrososphaera sp.]
MLQRSREEITSLILQSSEEGATQTTLMHETYLSHDTLKRHLGLLLEKGLLEYLAGEMKYKTTSKGLIYLSSGAAIGDQSCSHQCKKCGILYYCKQTNCEDPFHHAICHRCLQFFNRNMPNRVQDVLDKITLSSD